MLVADDISAKTVGRNIHHLRAAKKLTQLQVAIEAGITPICLSRYENGKQYPSLPNALRIARILDTSVDELMNDQLSLPSRGDLLVGVA